MLRANALVQELFEVESGATPACAFDPKRGCIVSTHVASTGDDTGSRVV